MIFKFLYTFPSIKLKTVIPFIIFILIVAMYSCNREKNQPTINIIYPQDGAIINVGEYILAEITPDFPKGQIQKIEFDYSKDGVNYFPMYGSVPMGVLKPATIWSTDSLSSGDYFIRAHMISTDKGSAKDIIKVKINEQPFAIPEVELLSNEGLPEARVLIDASKSYDPDGEIINYAWSIEGEEIKDDTVKQVISLRPGEYEVILTVTDNLQGIGVNNRVLNVSLDSLNGDYKIAFQEVTNCGCQEMKIKWGGDVEGENFSFDPESGSNIPEGHQTTLGPYNDGNDGDQLDMNKDDWVVKLRLEIIARLSGISEPAICVEGQRAQATVIYHKGKENEDKDDWPFVDITGQRSFFSHTNPAYDSRKSANDPYTDLPKDDPRIREEAKEGGEECGYNTDKWRDDNYHGGRDRFGRGTPGGRPYNRRFKMYDRGRTSKQILWLDAVGIRVRKQDLPVEYKARLQAIVDGESGSCKCTWDVEISVDETGKVTKNEPSIVEKDNPALNNNCKGLVKE